MLGRKERRQPELFMTGLLRQLLPDDHVLVRVDRVLDLEWLRAEVAELYDADMGRPGIDPEVAVRLMLAGFPLGIVHDRRLIREAQVQSWLDNVANSRRHATTGRVVSEAFADERPSLQSLPTIPFRAVLRLERRISQVRPILRSRPPELTRRTEP